MLRCEAPVPLLCPRVPSVLVLVLRWVPACCSNLCLDCWVQAMASRPPIPDTSCGPHESMLLDIRPFCGPHRLNGKSKQSTGFCGCGKYADASFAPLSSRALIKDKHDRKVLIGLRWQGLLCLRMHLPNSYVHMTTSVDRQHPSFESRHEFSNVTNLHGCPCKYMSTWANNSLESRPVAACVKIQKHLKFIRGLEKKETPPGHGGCARSYPGTACTGGNHGTQCI
jgi:hypothetical protein